MSWELKDEKSQAVLSLPGDRRYAYFVIVQPAVGNCGRCSATTGGAWLRMTTADRAFPRRRCGSCAVRLNGESCRRAIHPARCAETKTGVTANRHPA